MPATVPMCSEIGNQIQGKKKRTAILWVHELHPLKHVSKFDFFLSLLDSGIFCSSNLGVILKALFYILFC